MAGSNAVAAKAAILAGLQAAMAAGDGLSEVQVAYLWPGRTLEREGVYGGKIHMDHEYLAFRPGVRMPRKETATIAWVVEVRHLAADEPADADERALVLGAVLENLIAADPTLGGVVKNAAITSIDLDNVIDDDALTSIVTYEVTVLSQLD
jgi:hypothetical protein